MAKNSICAEKSLKMQNIPRWISASPRVSEQQAPVQNTNKATSHHIITGPIVIVAFFSPLHQTRATLISKKFYNSGILHIIKHVGDRVLISEIKKKVKQFLNVITLLRDGTSHLSLVSSKNWPSTRQGSERFLN